MADRTAARMPSRGQTGLGRAGRGPASRRAAEADAKAAAARHSRPPYDLGADAGGSSRNLAAAVGTGLFLAGLFVICYVIGPAALVGLATLAIAGCALEAFGMFQRAGFRPATLVGAVGSGGAVLAAYWKGTAAMPEVFVVVLFASLVWYLARVVDARPVVNVAVTIFGFAWVGVLGSFAALLLQVHQGSHLFLGAVVPTVAADMVAWLVGSRIGRHPMAPATSPSKTWEGFAAGGIAALAAGAVIGSQVAPWGGVRHGLELGLVVALVAPLGDLVQSMVKRDLRLKDSGAMLPGHGGLLDRFDSLLFVLPATYFLVLVLHIVK
jgi:phosphatidate cytidylyltransferase